MKITKKIYFQFLFVSMLFLIVSCTNPFAPKLTGGNQDIITDQTFIDGVFENFRYAYIFKDTLVYGRLLADNFTFTYHNYEKNIDVTWGRTEDMITTNGLFNAAQSLDLIWNQVIIAIGDSSRINISRGFNLNVIFDPSYSEQIIGRVNLILVRPEINGVWKIEKWTDESNF